MSTFQLDEYQDEGERTMANPGKDDVIRLASLPGLASRAKRVRSRTS